MASLGTLASCPGLGNIASLGYVHGTGMGLRGRRFTRATYIPGDGTGRGHGSQGKEVHQGILPTRGWECFLRGTQIEGGSKETAGG